MMRLSGGLPTVKCSSCHAEIDIASMGEHVCSQLSKAAAPIESIPWRTNTVRSSGKGAANGMSSGLARQMKPPPARIDPLTANRSFPYRDAPKNEGTRGLSSMSSRRSSNSTSPGTAPTQGSSFRWHQTPPSPKSSNLDCAFPPFPLGNVPPKTASDLPRKEASRLNVAAQIDAPEPSPLYGPLSPRTFGGENVVQKMNSIAPGPFGVKEQRKPNRLPQQSSEGFNASQISAPLGRLDLNSVVGERRQENHKAREVETMTRTRREYNHHEFPATARTQPSPSRSNTFPMENQSTAPSQRRPTEPRLDTRSGGTPLGTVGSKQEDFDRAAQNPYSTAAAMHSSAVNANSMESRYDPRLGGRQYIAGTSRTDQHSMDNAYHTPTESVSSNGSGYGSDTRTASSRSTPPMSESPERLTSMAFGGSLAAKSRDEVRYGKDFPALHSSSNSHQDCSLSNKGQQNSAMDLKHRYTSVQAPNSSPDPALQGERHNRRPSLAAQVAQSTCEQRPPGSPRAHTTAKKGNCRGCGQNILGKSVSSADGRLTGRYHKQCFVCRTCKAPFDTTTFYVLNNHPYCEQHYHQLNNSLCQACDRGIEGQYLETERRQKFHPDCLTCQECRTILRDEYYEMNSRVYCERHAFKLSQQSAFLGPGRRNPERRTTRMLVMG